MHTRWKTPLLFISLSILLTFLWGLFFWRLLTPNPADSVLFAEGDFTQHLYAFARYYAERVSIGQFPLWNPYNYAGDSFIGNIQQSAFYPPLWASVTLFGKNGYPIETYQLTVAWHYWLASILMLAFARAYFKRWDLAIFGAVTFAYGGYLTGYPVLHVTILQSGVWLPLVLLGALMSLSWRGWEWHGSAIAGLGCALSILGGHPQTTLHVISMGVLFLGVMGVQSGIRAWGIIGRVVGMGAIAGGLSAIQLLPALDFTREAYRLNYSFLDKSAGFLPSDWLSAVVPSVLGQWSPLFIGTAGMILAGIALSAPKNRYALWVGVVVLGGLLSLGANHALYEVGYALFPPFALFRQQERIASLISFALIMLAIEGLAVVLNRQERPQTRYYLWGYVAILGGLSAVSTLLARILQVDGAELPRFTESLTLTFITAGLFVGWWHWQQKAHSGWHLVGLIALVASELFTVGHRTNYVPATSEHRLKLPPILEAFQTAPHRIEWRIDGASSLQGYAVYWGIADIYGTGPITLERLEYLRQIPVERFWEVLSVRYVTVRDPLPENVAVTYQGTGLAYDGKPFDVYELDDPRPMAHLVYDSRSAGGNPTFALELMSDPRVPLREMAITLQDLPRPLPVTRPDLARIDTLQWTTPEHLELTVSTGENALLTLSIPYFTGWRATVNGHPTPLLEANGGLSAIWLESGENQSILLQFLPDSLLIGASLTLFTALLWAISLVVAPRFFVHPSHQKEAASYE